MSDLPDRDELERRYSRMLSRLLRAYGKRLVETLGFPPDLNNIPHTFWRDGERELIAGLTPLVEDVYLNAARRLVAQSPIGVDWGLVNQGAVDWSRSYLFDQVQGMTQTNQRMLQSALAGYFNTPGQTRGELEAILMRGYSPIRAEMIAVTEITRAATQGERGVADELAAEGVEMIPVWQTNNDEIVRRCPICWPRHGKPIKDGQFPPGHVRCRCWVNHVFPGELEELPSEPEAEKPPEKPKAPAWPTDPGTLEQVRFLGGSTGAYLVRDPATGVEYVMKRGAAPDHLRREVLADQVYRAMGIKVPDVRLYETPTGPVKLARFVQGRQLSEIINAGELTPALTARLRSGFLTDALLGNWDVLGTGFDNILVDDDGEPWRIDNGGSFEFRAQGDTQGKVFDRYPLELWSMRNKNINPYSARIFGDMSYTEIIDELRTYPGTARAALDVLPADLRGLVADRLSMMTRAVTVYDDLRAGSWNENYPDKFTFHSFGLGRAGVFDKLPGRLSWSGSTPDTDVFDEAGNRFDNLRGSSSTVMADLKSYIDANGGDYGMIAYYLGEQASSSWSTGAAAMKRLIAENMDLDDSQVFWWQYEDGKDAYNKTVARFGREKWQESLQAFHAFNYEFVQRVDFPNNNRAAGTVDIIRTEDSVVLKGQNFKKGDKDIHIVRGLAESGSAFVPYFYKGDQVTLQTVPHSRILANYMYSRRPGSYDGALAGDHENEIVFVPYQVKGQWIGTLTEYNRWLSKQKP